MRSSLSGHFILLYLMKTPFQAYLPAGWVRCYILSGKEICRMELLTGTRHYELPEMMRMKFTEIDCFASTGVVGGVLSGNTFNNLCIGGLNKHGASAANDLELLILESGMTCATPQPTLSILYDEKLPEEMLMKAIECTKSAQVILPGSTG